MSTTNLTLSGPDVNPPPPPPSPDDDERERRLLETWLTRQMSRLAAERYTVAVLRRRVASAEARAVA